VNPLTKIVLAAVALAVIFFVPRVRRAVGAATGIVIAIVAIAVAVGGTAVLMNNVTIFDSPGTFARIKRFLTVDWAATNHAGSGSVQCEYGWPGEPFVAPLEIEHNRPRARRGPALPPQAGNRGLAPPGSASREEDFYPELIAHGFPGIPRAQLFDDAQQAVNSLGGWKIVNLDRSSSAFDCLYTSRLLRFEDEIRIVVTVKNRVYVCSRSKSRLFPGDFGANIGHVKEFEEALEPRVETFYKEQEKRIRAMSNGERS